MASIVFTSVCFWCAAQHDRIADDLNPGASPKPGDCSICFDCAKPNVFDKQLQLREPTKAEQLILDADIRIQEAIRAIRQVRSVRDFRARRRS